MNKQELRVKFKKIRREFQDKQAASKTITSTFLSLPETRKAKVIALYCSLPEEVATDELIKSLLKEGKTVCVPLIQDKNMLFIRISGPADLKGLGSFGIREPLYRKEDEIPPEEIEVAVFPGLAFDTKGNRLGYGGGYYDRAFAGNPVSERIAFCFACQLSESIPSEDHDLKMDKIITQDGMYET